MSNEPAESITRVLHERVILRAQAFDAMHEAVLIAGDDRRYVDANAAACALLGRSHDEVLAMRVDDVSPPPPEVDVEAEWRAFLEKGESVGEFRIVRPDGSTVVAEFAAKANVTPGRHVSVLRDVTEQVRLREEKRRSDEHRDRILAIVGHDLRNPLGTISAAVKLLSRGGLSADDHAKLVEHMAHASGRMERMIEQLLDYEQAENARFAVVRRTVDLGALARRLLEDTASASPQRAFELRMETPSVVGEWDEDRLAQLLSNLLRNAVEHGKGTVTLVVGADEASAWIETRNAGMPIPPDALPRIFDAFRRAGRGSARGLGLGLFIARQIAEAHGGTITARSGASETAFRVVLPRRSIVRR